MSRSYEELPNDVLLSQNELPADIFLRLGHVKYIRIFAKADPLEKERINRYIEKSKYELPFFVLGGELSHFLKDKYVPVRVGTFLVDKLIPIQTYLKEEGQNEFNEFLPANSIFERPTYESLKQRGIRRFYILSEDEGKYQSMLDKVIDKIIEGTDSDLEEKAYVLREVGTKRIEETYQDFNLASMDRLKDLLKNLMKFVDENDLKGLKNLLSQQQEGDVYQHVLNVSTICYSFMDFIHKRHKEGKCKNTKVVTQQLDLNDQSKNTVAIAGMLHDLGKIIDPQAKLEQHPQTAANVIVQMSDAITYKKIAEVMLQHEEFCDGSGYPNQLKKAQISMYSQIVSMVNYYDKLLSDEDNDEEDVLNQMQADEAKFNKYLLNIFVDMVKQLNRHQTKKVLASDLI